MTPTNRLRAVSTSETDMTPKGGMVRNLSGLRSPDARPARRAVSSLALIVLASLPIPTGTIEATSDGASLLLAPAVATPLADEATPRAYVRERASRDKGWTGRQWACLDALIHRESRWNPTADNKHSSAYGLFQQLRLDPSAPVSTQTRLGLKYIAHRYGTPCRAYSHAITEGWF